MEWRRNIKRYGASHLSLLDLQSSPSLWAPSCQFSVLTRLSFQMAGAGQSWQRDAADQNFDYMFKLLIIGNSSVGKTSFLFR